MPICDRLTHTKHYFNSPHSPHLLLALSNTWNSLSPSFNSSNDQVVVGGAEMQTDMVGSCLNAYRPIKISIGDTGYGLWWYTASPVDITCQLKFFQYRESGLRE